MFKKSGVSLRFRLGFCAASNVLTTSEPRRRVPNQPDCECLPTRYFLPKSPAAVMLPPLLTAENPASVSVQSVMIARWPGLFIHHDTAAAGASLKPVLQKMTSPSEAYGA
jgi:hypothetical protein